VLLPREHGAYGQLLFPLAAALMVGHPSGGAWLLAGAALGAFLAHEALLVVLGQRGARASREQAREARQSLALFGGFALVTGIVSLSVLPASVWPSLAAPLLFALLTGVAVVTHRERTTIGEIVVGVALASVCVPVARAGEVGEVAIRTLFLVFSTVFVVATLGVRAMIGRVTKRPGSPHPGVAIGATLVLLASLSALALRGVVAARAPVTALPVVLVAIMLVMRPPQPKHLRIVGWTLVGTTLLTTLMLIVALTHLA
jgi:hypothetical protein